MNRIQDLEQQHDIVLVEVAGVLAVPFIERTKGFYYRLQTARCLHFIKQLGVHP